MHLFGGVCVGAVPNAYLSIFIIVCLVGPVSFAPSVLCALRTFPLRHQAPPPATRNKDERSSSSLTTSNFNLLFTFEVWSNIIGRMDNQTH